MTNTKHATTAEGLTEAFAAVDKLRMDFKDLADEIEMAQIYIKNTNALPAQVTTTT